MNDLRRRYGRSKWPVGTFVGVGRIAGIRVAYVTWSNGKTSDYRLREFRSTFGVPASALVTGAVVTPVSERYIPGSS